MCTNGLLSNTDGVFAHYNTEKILFAQAITGFSINVNSIYQPTEAGLRGCLIALQKAMIPEKERDESYAQRDDNGELISYAKLVATVEKIKEQIS